MEGSHGESSIEAFKHKKKKTQLKTTPYPTVFDSEMVIHHSVSCYHTSDCGSDAQLHLRNTYGPKYGDINRECMSNNGILLSGYENIIKDFVLYYLKKNGCANYQQYADQIDKNAIKQCEHYHLFHIAAFHSIIGHLSTFFSVDNFYQHHRNFITNMINDKGGNICHDTIYDYTLQEIYDHVNENKKDYVVQNESIRIMCDIFEQKLNDIMQEPMDILVTFYMLNYYRAFEMQNSCHYLGENIIKSLCVRNHNQMYYKFKNGTSFYWSQYQPILTSGIKNVILTPPINDMLKKIKNIFTNDRPNIDFGIKNMARILPDQSKVQMEGVHLLLTTVQVPQQLYFIDGQKMVYMSNHKPDMYHITGYIYNIQQHEFHSLIWDGMNLWFVNEDDEQQLNNHLLQYYIMSAQDYLIWVSSSVPTWSQIKDHHKHKLLVPEKCSQHGIHGLHLQKITKKMAIMSFTPSEIQSFQWLMDHYDSGPVTMRR